MRFISEPTEGMRRVKLIVLWEHAKDLNFGEICEVYDAAMNAADDKVFEIRKAKIIAAANEPQEKQP